MKSRCLIGEIREISTALDNAVKRRILKDGLPIRQNHIPLFYILPEAGESMSFNELMKEWGISKSTLSEIVTRYEGLGFVQKLIDHEDRRSVQLSLTAQAVVIKNHLYKMEDEILENLLKEFSSEDQEAFRNFVLKALQTMPEAL